MTEGQKRTAIAVVSLAIGALAYGIFKAVFETSAEDDQPPVVVSSGGSAVFEPQDNGYSHGGWTQNGNKQIVYDPNGNGNYPQKFTIRLYYLAANQPAECDKPFKNAIALQGNLNTGSQFTVSITGAPPNRRLTVDASSNGGDDTFTVTGYTAHYAAQAAYLTNVLVNGVTCNFDGQKGRFIIHQLH
jgi:hypothetical protein